MLIDILCKFLGTFFYSTILKGAFHIRVRNYRRTIDGSKRLFGVRCLLEEIHELLELIFRALRRSVSILVHYLEGDIILFHQVIRASATVFDRGREANVGRGLGEGRGVVSVILDGAEDCVWSWNMRLGDTSASRGIYGSLEMEFLLAALSAISLICHFGL